MTEEYTAEQTIKHRELKFEYLPTIISRIAITNESPRPKDSIRIMKNPFFKTLNSPSPSKSKDINKNKLSESKQLKSNEPNISNTKYKFITTKNYSQSHLKSIYKTEYTNKFLREKSRSKEIFLYNQYNNRNSTKISPYTYLEIKDNPIKFNNEIIKNNFRKIKKRDTLPEFNFKSIFEKSNKSKKNLLLKDDYMNGKILSIKKSLSLIKGVIDYAYPIIIVKRLKSISHK